MWNLIVTPLITYPVFPSSGYSGQSGHGRDGQTLGRDGAQEDFGPVAKQAAASVAEPQESRALTTPRDALYFRIQTETLPGPGSTAPYLAQQIGQLWIAPDVRIDHNHAAAAYRHANQGGALSAVSVSGWSVIA